MTNEITNHNIFEQVKMYMDTLHENEQNGGMYEYIVSGSRFLYHKAVGSCINLISDELTSGKKNVFITLNSYHTNAYNGKTSIRKDKNLWGLDCFMIDIDGPTYFCGREQELYDSLSWIWKKEFLPEPNLYSFTGGGGIHLYYAFKRVPKQIKKAVNTLKKVYAAKMQEVINEYELFDNFVYWNKDNELVTYHIDTKIFDTQRCDRIPGSINPKTGNRCVCFKTNTGRYSIQDLFSYIQDEDYVPKKKKQKRKTIKNKRILSIPMTRLFNKRVTGLFELQRNGKDFTGCRNYALFILINSLKQLQKSQGYIQNTVLTFNSGFTEPLRASELNGLLKSIQKETVYKFTNDFIKNSLCLTPDEEKIMFSRKRPGTKKKQMFNDRVNVAKLVLQGNTISEISAKLNISESRVKKARCFIKENGGFEYWAAGCSTKKYIKTKIKKIIDKYKKPLNKGLLNAAKKYVVFCYNKSSFCNILNIFSESITYITNNNNYIRIPKSLPVYKPLIT